MPPVRVETAALSDSRYALLGRLLGTSRFDALGRLIHVWSYCTEHQVYTCPAYVLDGIMEREDAAALLIRAGLAEDVDGQVRIRGLEGRIEWYREASEKKVRGGKARARSAHRDQQGAFTPASTASTPPAASQHTTSSQPAHHQQPASTPPAQASAPTPTPTLTTKDPDPESSKDDSPDPEPDQAATRPALRSVPLPPEPVGPYLKCIDRDLEHSEYTEAMDRRRREAEQAAPDRTDNPIAETAADREKYQRDMAARRTATSLNAQEARPLLGRWGGVPAVAQPAPGVNGALAGGSVAPRGKDTS